MEKNDLTRSYLETLSSDDLIALSDDYGIDLPDNLARCFIITEILDSLEEQNLSKDNLAEPEKKTEALELPFSYNENKIVAILRNPAWCYVTWDFKRETLFSHTDNSDFGSFLIRFSYHADKSTDDVVEVFDVQINIDDREQFILLNSDHPSFHVSLIALSTNQEKEILATSQRILKPKLPLDISLASLQKTFSPIQTLSGLPSILKTHYNEHRHSFVRD